MSLRSTGWRIRIILDSAGALAFVLSASWWTAMPAGAQSQAPAAREKPAEGKVEPPPDRRKALALAEAHRDLEALPLLEALAKADPKDREVHERLAVALVTRSATVKPDEARQVLQRARSILLELRKTGPISDLGQILADGLPPDGRAPTFSNLSEAQAAMKEGEAAFARRDFEAARKAYQRALTLDPNLYHAALFVGDTYFASNKYQQARTWFSRAILINSNKETAHRYLGDTLVKMEELAAARLSYIDAIIAEPYSRRPWLGLGNWSRASHIMPQHLRVVPEELDRSGDAAKGGLAAAPAAKAGEPDDGRSHWHRYRETRQVWRKDKFQKTFPGAPYRHSLAEEADALRQVARAIAVDVKAGRIKQPHPCFAGLIQLERDGLLEAYVLFARADGEIAADYEAYRDAHRGELRRYLRKYVVPTGDVEPDADLLI